MKNREKACWTAILAYAALPLSTDASATAARSSAQAPDNSIVVTADKKQRSLSEIIKDFTAASPDEKTEQVAYWNMWLCVKVEGLISPQASYLHRRIEDNLRQSGLHVLSKPNCATNIEVIFPPDSDAYVQHFVKVTPGLYRDLDKKGFPPPEEVDKLLKPRAVRWLAVRRDVSVAKVSTDNDPHIVGIPDASHITLGTGALKIGELVVIDYRRLHHVTWDQLADYVSMVLLANPDMDTDYSRDSTILALFASPDDGSHAPPEMTDRDHLVAKGFSKMDQIGMPFVQRDTIARTVEAAEKRLPAR